ncbi:MAG: hypothetical protein JSV56_02945, partial [Methanomassiliicoccales archaeon]
TITDDEVLNSSQLGMRFTERSNATIEGCSIIDSEMWSVYCDGPTFGGSSPKFYNSTLDSVPSAGEIYVNDDSHPWLLNTTFKKDMTQFGDMVSNITVNWYMHVKVVDTDEIGVGGATVWINDTYGNELYNPTTDGQGWSRWNVVTEYIEQDSDGDFTGEKTYYTPHNVSALESGRFGFSLATMSKSRVVVVMLNGISFEIMLKKGWNMISIPVNRTSTLLEDVLSAIDGNYIAVQWFNTSDPIDPWKHYHVNKVSLGMNDLSSVDRRKGIWILMKSDDIFPVVGAIPDPSTTDIELKKGWNFVGYPSITVRIAGNDTNEAFESIADDVDLVQYYNASATSDHWEDWDPGSWSADDLGEIKPGYGLWIHVKGDCTWFVEW